MEYELNERSENDKPPIRIADQIARDPGRYDQSTTEFNIQNAQTIGVSSFIVRPYQYWLGPAAANTDNP